MLQLLSQHPLLIYIQKDCALIEAVPESSLVVFLYPHVIQWEWEIGEKAKTELTDRETDLASTILSIIEAMKTDNTEECISIGFFSIFYSTN